MRQVFGMSLRVSFSGLLLVFVLLVTAPGLSREMLYRVCIEAPSIAGAANFVNPIWVMEGWPAATVKKLVVMQLISMMPWGKRERTAPHHLLGCSSCEHDSCFD